MISLYKIRYTDLKKHPCQLVFGYLFIPVCLITFFLPASIIHAAIKRNDDDYYYMVRTSMQNNQHQHFLNLKNNKPFNDFIANDLINSVIISDNIIYGKKLREFIKNETNVKLDYYLDEKEVNITNYENLIIYKEKEGNNFFNLKIKDKSKLNFNISNIKKISEIKKVLNYIKNSIFAKNENSHRITNLECLIMKYLASQNNLYSFPNISVNSDFKSFRDEYEDDENNEASDIIIGLVISLEMTLLSYYLTERMIEEKEKKLNDFLERQGISKKKYSLSWFVTYSLLSLAPFIGFMCFGGYFFVYRYYLFLANLVLYMFDIYSVMYFLYTIIPSLKKGSIIIKIFNFASTLLGAAASLPETKRGIKIVFCMIPNINIYYTVSVMYQISKGKYLRDTNLKTKVKRLSYIETLIFFVAEFIFYNGATLIINSYKRSGLNFCLYLKSFCCKISANNLIENRENLIEENEASNLSNYECHHQNLSIIEQQKKK